MATVVSWNTNSTTGPPHSNQQRVTIIQSWTQFSIYVSMRVRKFFPFTGQLKSSGLLQYHYTNSVSVTHFQRTYPKLSTDSLMSCRKNEPFQRSSSASSGEVHLKERKFLHWWHHSPADINSCKKASGTESRTEHSESSCTVSRRAESHAVQINFSIQSPQLALTFITWILHASQRVRHTPSSVCSAAGVVGLPGHLTSTVSLQHHQ
jgi:hypothetical protein